MPGGSDLAEDCLHIDGQVAMRTTKPAHDAKAESLRAFLKGDAAGPRTAGGWGDRSGHRTVCVCVQVACVCENTHSGSAVGVSVLADTLELLDRLST